MSPETKILWLPASDVESRSVFDYESNTFTGGGSSSRNPAGVRIDANTALNSTIVLACVRVLAEGLATLPLHVYARSKDGGKETARTHPLYKVLHDRPNDWQTSFEWREMQMLHLGIYGQSFNEIIRDKRDIISALVPLHPSRMRVESIETGMLRYTYQEESGRLTVYPQDQIMHIRWMSNDGVNGMVPIELARDAIGLARACEIHGASFFANGARPGLVLSTDNTLSVEAAESLRVNWERVHRGPDKAQKTAVLTGGLKPVEFGNTNQESQFLETRRFQIEEICRLYRVPGSLVGDLSRSNFANIEQQSIDFVQFTLLPWLRRFESAFKRDLLGDDDVHFVEFDTRGLMRGDAAARASYYSTLHQLGVASVNELRAWENLNPVEGGDARFTPLNMQTLENASKQVEEKPEPPIPAASVSEMVAVLGQVSGGTVAPESAKAIMMAAFPTLSDELAGRILAGVAGPPPEKPAEPGPDKPAADVGGLVAILAQVKDGGLTGEAAVAALGSVYPDLPAATAQQIVAGVNQPPEPPPPEKPPAADVDGLLAILGQVSQGAVTPEAATTILAAVFPKMPAEMAQAIVAGAKSQQQQGPPPEGGEPAEGDQPADDEEPAERAKPGTVSEGDFVSWNSAGGRARGRIDHVMDYGTLDVPGTDLAIDASEDDPAALITVYEKVAGGWRETDTQVGHKVATLTKIEPLESPKDARAFCPGASPPDNSCSPSNKGEGKPVGADTKDPEFKKWFDGSIAKNDDGSPMTIWRGGKERESFDPSAAVPGGGEYGIFVTPREATAKAYAGDGGVHAYYANVKNPLYVEGKYEISAGQLSKSDIDRLREQGYDSIAVVDKPGSTPLRDAHEIVLFQDNQIVSAERVSSAGYGMEYSPRNERVVAKAREVPDSGWNQIPVEDVPHGTVLQANEKTLKLAPIDKVVSGREPFRQNYVAKLWRDREGNLHVVDGHHRVAMYHALGKDMPARVMTQEDYDALMGGSRAFCPGASPPDNSCSPANKGDGGKSEKGSTGSGGVKKGGPGSKGKKAPSLEGDAQVRPEPKDEKPQGASDVSVKSLRSHADKVAGGSDIDGSLRTPEFPNGAVVPRDIEKLEAYHAAKKTELAERIDVPSDKSAQVQNAATTVEELLADAREVVPAYKNLVEQAARESGSEASLGKVDPKDPSFDYLSEHAGGTHMLKAPLSLEPKVGRIRAEEKIPDSVPDSQIVRDKMKDAVRGTLISDTPESLGDAVRSVRQQAESQGLAVTVKNRFLDSEETGYAAVHMTLQMRTPAGRPVMTELQFHLRQAYDGNRGSPKDNSHGLYKPDPKTQRITRGSAAAQMLIWSRAFEDIPPPPDEGDRSQRAWCPGASPPDNSCSPSNKGGGGKKSGANKKGGKGVSNAGRKVKFGTVAKAALDNLRKTGGFSVHPVTSGSPTTGYMVSVKPEAEVVYDSVDKVNEAAFRDFYRANKAAFAENSNLHFGGWVDTNTGKVYFDLSARYDNVREAVDAAKATKQLAIWHLDEGREIRQEDYDARRKQGRSQAARTVRLPRRTARRRGTGLQGDGRGVSGVRPQSNGGQAGRPAIFSGRRRSGPINGRAFCPGASPPDNSCSPANKGTGGPTSVIKRPEPDWDNSVTTGYVDPRGALTGHSESQRQKYAEDTAKWLSDRGVELSIISDDKGSPTVDAMHSIMRGVEKAEILGIEVPSKITMRGDLGSATFAAFRPSTGELFVSHDLSSEDVRFSIENRYNTGDPRDPDSSVIIHELSHRDHFAAMRASGGDARAMSNFHAWTGKLEQTPDGVRATANPWAPGFAAQPTGMDASEAKKIARAVSSYAATNPLEFVAEVRTSIAAGNRHSKRVMSLYRSYLGPDTPAIDSPAAEAA